MKPCRKYLCHVDLGCEKIRFNGIDSFLFHIFLVITFRPTFYFNSSINFIDSNSISKFKRVDMFIRWLWWIHKFKGAWKMQTNQTNVFGSESNQFSWIDFREWVRGEKNAFLLCHYFPLIRRFPPFPLHSPVNDVIWCAAIFSIRSAFQWNFNHFSQIVILCRFSCVCVCGAKRTKWLISIGFK